MKTKRVYKVVKKYGDFFVSAIVSPGYDKRAPLMPQLVYSIGNKTVRPKVAGPIFAFDTLRSAQKFVGQNEKPFIVFEAQATNVRRAARFKFYNDRMMKGDTQFIAGTVFCDTVKLTKLVS